MEARAAGRQPRPSPRSTSVRSTTPASPSTSRRSTPTCATPRACTSGSTCRTWARSGCSWSSWRTPACTATTRSVRWSTRRRPPAPRPSSCARIAAAVRDAGVDPARSRRSTRCAPRRPRRPGSSTPTWRSTAGGSPPGTTSRTAAWRSCPTCCSSSIRAAGSRRGRPADDAHLPSIAALRDEVPAEHREAFDDAVRGCPRLVRLAGRERSAHLRVAGRSAAPRPPRGRTSPGRAGALGRAEQVFELRIPEVAALLTGAGGPGRAEIDERAATVAGRPPSTRRRPRAAGLAAAGRRPPPEPGPHDPGDPHRRRVAGGRRRPRARSSGMGIGEETYIGHGPGGARPGRGPRHHGARRRHRGAVHRAHLQRRAGHGRAPSSPRRAACSAMPR